MQAAGVVETAARVLNQGECRTGLPELQADFEREAAAGYTARHARAIRARVHADFERRKAGVPDTDIRKAGIGYQPAEHATALQFANRLVAAAAGPPGDIVAALNAAAESISRARPDSYLADTAPGEVTALKGVLETQCLVTAAAVAVAVERHRLRTGAWPATLNDIPADILPRVPADPAAGGPVSYKRLDDGVVVYSVGSNGIDDGGKVWPPTWFPDKDFGLRLWDAAKRHVPPPVVVDDRQ